MILVDGRLGEGGGQVLRTSLSLSAVTGRPFRIDHIRANRSRPGLRPQHLTAVQAVAAICQAELSGAEIDSTSLTFRPTLPPQGGSYAFDVTEVSPSGRSAGAVTLIFQALLWPLLFAREPSQVRIRGGTFVPFSPPYHYLQEVARPAYARFGAAMTVQLAAWGWMAGGDGEIVAGIQPAAGLQGVKFEPEPVSVVGGVAAVTNLPSHIPHRMARRAHNLLQATDLASQVEPRRERGSGPGAGIVLWIPQAGFSSLGRKGLPADKVAEAAVAELLSFMDNGMAVDRYLADQLLLPMALARGRSSSTTDRLTRHTLTNIQLLQQWLDLAIEVDGQLNQPGRIAVTGIGFGRS
jgi:RNA 3'-terminal phosphate cyclase (ATP)